VRDKRKCFGGNESLAKRLKNPALEIGFDRKSFTRKPRARRQFNGSSKSYSKRIKIDFG
jgi:hypothetical protein